MGSESTYRVELSVSVAGTLLFDILLIYINFIVSKMFVLCVLNNMNNMKKGKAQK